MYRRRRRRVIDPVDAAAKCAPLGVIPRLTQIGFALLLLYWLLFATFTQGQDFPYDLHAVTILFQLVSSAVCISLLQQRARKARIVIIVTLFVDIYLMATEMVLRSAGIISQLKLVLPLPLLLVSFTIISVLCLLLIFYYWRCRRLQDVLTRSLKRTPEEREAREKAQLRIDTRGDEMTGKSWRTWEWWRNLIIHYCSFTIIGHWAEMCFCLFILMGLAAGSYDPSNHMLWNEWLYPFPAEGIAVVFIVMVLHPLKEWFIDRCGHRRLPALLLSFLANALVCTSIDFTMGITTNADYHLWNYSDLPFNFMGQICLQNSLVYSIAATIFVWALYPAMERLVHRPSEAMMNTFFAGMMAFYAFLELLYVVNVGPTGLLFG